MLFEIDGDFANAKKRLPHAETVFEKLMRNF